MATEQMALVTELWFYCNHHTQWERFDSVCLLEHQQTRAVWGDDKPCTLYKNGILVGHYGIEKTWRTCEVCISKNDEWLEEYRTHECDVRFLVDNLCGNPDHQRTEM